MKVAFVHAGMKAYRNRLFDLLSENFDITFFFYGGKKVIGQSRSEWGERAKNWSYTIMEPIRNIGYTFLTPQVVWRVRKYPIVITSDLLSFQTHILYLWTRFTRQTFIIWGENWDWPRTLAGSLLRSYVRLAVRSADSCIVAGSKAQEFFIELGADPEKVFIAPNAAERLKLPAPEDIQRLKDKHALQEKRVVLYLARIVPYKGLEYLLRAFAVLEKADPSLMLLVAGGGDDYERRCRGLAAELRIQNIIWLGVIPHSQVASIYSLADVYVLPSTFRKDERVTSEAWGLSLNEAASMGVPLVSTDAVAAAFDIIIEGENGYRVRPGDVGALTTAIQGALKLEKSSVKKASESILERFTYEQQTDGFVKAVNYALKE